LNDGSRPRVLVCATMWWPLSARLAMAFLRHGCDVCALCPPGHPLRFVTGIDSISLYRGSDSATALKAAITAARADLIVPGDDGVVWQLHELHAREPALRPLIEKSLGSADAYPAIRSRGQFLQTAKDLGIRIPSTRTINSEKDLDKLPEGLPAVLKLDGTWGGTGVSIVRSHSEALTAFRALARPVGAATACKRWLVNSDPIALWMWRRRGAARVTVQQFIPGRPANTMFACWQGELLGLVTVEVIASQGATGAATIVRIVNNEQIAEAARLLARKFTLSGFHGLDFILERETGDAYLIELNPRCTQLGHLPLPSQGDLAEALCKMLRNEPDCEIEDPIHGDTVAFFPQAFHWNPKSPYLRSGYHDVPWEHPELVRQLLREPWPERQWLSRLYHWFRPHNREKEVEF
jgi:ATP-grasp domain